jgi:hypothetical protein
LAIIFFVAYKREEQTEERKERKTPSLHPSAVFFKYAFQSPHDAVAWRLDGLLNTFLGAKASQGSRLKSGRGTPR